MWIWLIGKSGSRKTTAVAEIHGLLRKLFPARDPENLFPNADSVEMFMECLRARDGIRTLRVEFEMGNFLARTDPRSRLGAMRAVMTEVYDGNEMTRAILQQEEMLVIEKPRLSFLGAGTPAHLDEHVRAIDFQGGFVSRFALLLGHGGSYEFQHSRPDPELEKKVLGALAQLRSWRDAPVKFGTCTGMTPDAQKLFNLWNLSLVHRKRQGSVECEGAYNRAAIMGLKTAFLFSMVESKERRERREGVRPGEWKIGLRALFHGAVFAEISLVSTRAVVTRMASTDHLKGRRLVLTLLEENGGAVEKSALLRKLQMPDRSFNSIIRTMVAELVVEVTTDHPTKVVLTKLGYEENPYGRFVPLNIASLAEMAGVHIDFLTPTQLEILKLRFLSVNHYPGLGAFVDQARQYVQSNTGMSLDEAYRMMYDAFTVDSAGVVDRLKKGMSGDVPKRESVSVATGPAVDPFALDPNQSGDVPVVSTDPTIAPNDPFDLGPEASKPTKPRESAVIHATHEMLESLGIL